MPRHRDRPIAVGHHDVFTVTIDPESRFLQCREPRPDDSRPAVWASLYLDLDLPHVRSAETIVDRRQVLANSIRNILKGFRFRRTLRVTTGQTRPRRQSPLQILRGRSCTSWWTLHLETPTAANRIVRVSSRPNGSQARVSLVAHEPNSVPIRQPAASFAFALLPVPSVSLPRRDRPPAAAACRWSPVACWKAWATASSVDSS